MVFYGNTKYICVVQRQIIHLDIYMIGLFKKRTIVVSIQNVNINNSSHIFKAYFSLLLTIQICLWISCLLHNIGIILQIILQLC